MKTDFGDIQSPEDRYEISDVVGCGVYGKIYFAIDLQANKKKVAIKCQKYETGCKEFVEEEYKILRDFSSHANIVDFYGIFKKSNEIWFALEPCEGGSVIDLVNRLFAKNRRMVEEHIAYVIKETVRGLVFLHENKIIHRDVKGSNILLTKEGEVKLCDFGLSKIRNEADEMLSVILGSPSWMAPELVNLGNKNRDSGYNDKIDVWSLGITTIELAEGKAPYQGMNPSRTLFQIVSNPPPTLKKVSNWTENFHDFISECLIKDFENRPCMMELLEHPFLGEVPDNNYHLAMEIKSLILDVANVKLPIGPADVVVHGKYIKKDIDGDIEPIYEEDLAALNPISERDILELLEKRVELGEYYTYIGDILLSLNPNETKRIYGTEFHEKYQFKSRSDNAPHIYSIADTAYQNAVHHKAVQQIVLSGETGSGKTSNYLHLVDHLFFLGENASVSSSRIKNTILLLHSLIHASTPSNIYATRAVFRTEINYGKSGKLSGASFKIHCIDKSRVSSTDKLQSNFHIFYYFYDGITSTPMYEKYKLNTSRQYDYLRISKKDKTNTPRDDIPANIVKYKKICSYLRDLEFTTEEIVTIHSVIVAILHLGEAKFVENEDMLAVLQNKEEVENFAELLDIDAKKICWALANYCVIKDGSAYKVRQTCQEATEVRNVLANSLYTRLVDYIVGTINNRLAFGKAIFGNAYVIKILDFFGFECFKENNFSQLIVNTFNEQLHYHFLQRVFSWELQDLQDEDIEFVSLSYYKNKDTLNEILGASEGLLSIIDDASKKGHNGIYITENLYYEEKKKIIIYDENTFGIVHYTGKVSYDCRKMPEKNRDFLAPEIIETMRSSKNPIIVTLFTAKLDRTGNLILPSEEIKKNKYILGSKISMNREYSQIRKMRTQSTIFRSLCLELLKELSIGSGSGGTHFVRCIRTDLKGRPNNFKRELVKHQLRAMGIADTAKIRQSGYSQRISFSEFLRRYKFLAFDFDESVDITKDNCRLLMIRLKMEDWALGKTKVFLKYYHEEYLSRLYETHVKKIIKIQSILRGFLVKCRLAKQIKEDKKEVVEQLQPRRRDSMTEDEAAEVIQKAYRNAARRREVLEAYKQLSEEDKYFIRPYARKWKNKTLFSVLMRYRAKRVQDFYNLAQQVHLYNMNAYHKLLQTKEGIDLDFIDIRAQVGSYLDDINNSVLKLYFRLEDIPFYNTSHMSDYLTNIGDIKNNEEPWDSPYRWRESRSQTKDESTDDDMDTNDTLAKINYRREPDEDLVALASPVESDDGKFTKDIINEDIRTQNRQTINSNKNVDEKNIKSGGNTQYKVNLKKIENSYKPHSAPDFLKNSSPANKDFDYIKATPINIKPKYSIDPLDELRNIGRRDSNASDDDPPYNFKGMLRKTNFRRESLNNVFQTVRKLSLTKENLKNSLSNGHYEDEAINGKHISVEILPGLVMEGVEIEL
ncbi:neither inactivation nor afterpotential protein C isoform X1 [Diorhabda carinulata]|uniref:neither inactivation nor afterpotential protein C isoform X1 n=1 Tax=Diorhabda carinulata TaxID=1163345 RepID=UPI0025A2B0A9|nr:neither inactivation nor afterpotential protein C isoform X1 [Diorhabda carinulata]